MNLEKKVLKIYLYNNNQKSLIFLILYGKSVVVNIKKRKKSKFTSILPIFTSLMVVPVYLTLVCRDSTPMTSLQDGELRLF